DPRPANNSGKRARIVANGDDERLAGRQGIREVHGCFLSSAVVWRIRRPMGDEGCRLFGMLQPYGRSTLLSCNGLRSVACGEELIKSLSLLGTVIALGNDDKDTLV